MAADAEAAGAVTAEEARRWLDELDERGRTGRVCLSVVKCRVAADKP